DVPEEILVHRAVTVVVESITDFIRAGEGSAGDGGARLAAGGDDLAAPHATGRRQEPLVGLSIAIVVQAVADLLRRRTLGAGPDRPFGARRHPTRACPHAAVELTLLLIHRPVAVVVLPVAGLRHGDARQRGDDTVGLRARARVGQERVAGSQAILST